MIKPRAGSRSAFLKVGFGLDGHLCLLPRNPRSFWWLELVRPWGLGMSLGHKSVQAWLCGLQVSPEVWAACLPAFPVLSRSRGLCGSSSAQDLVCDGG